MKIKINHNTVEETLIIPLYGRMVIEEKYPNLKTTNNTKEILDLLDYDFESKKKKMYSKAGIYGALEGCQREYDLKWEIDNYLISHPNASIVNLGCGLLDIFSMTNNGLAKCYNIDFPDVIKIRNQLLKLKENEYNISCDLNDFSWMDEIDNKNGVIFVAAGVFYYFKREDIIKLFNELSNRFKGSSLAFDTCNKKGLKIMLKTVIKEAEIKDVGAFFGLSKPEKELKEMNIKYNNISIKSYMNGYRKLKYRLLYKILNFLMDHYVKSRIIRLDF